MLKVNPYLNFDGKTEEAFNFYKTIFGGEFTMVSRFGDMPAGEHPMAESEKNLIMHIALPIGENTILMATDISKESGMKLIEGNNNYISLHADTKKEGERLFNLLSEGGMVEMPFNKMFWGDYFSSFKDKYGTNWMVNVLGTEEN